MTHTHELTAPPADALEVGEWQLDHDGYGRPFRGTRRGEVVIAGWQRADGQAERSILMDSNEYPIALKHPRASAQAILDADDEIEALQAGPTRWCAVCFAQLSPLEGNNPWPVIDDDDSFCCNDCNSQQVMPARAKLHAEVEHQLRSWNHADEKR